MQGAFVNAFLAYLVTVTYKTARAIIATQYQHSTDKIEPLIGNITLTEDLSEERRITCTFHSKTLLKAFDIE